MDFSDHVSVTNCTKCGFKIVKPSRKRPNDMFGNILSCPECDHEWVVTWSIFRHKDETGGVLDDMTTRCSTPRIEQSLLSEFD